MSKFADFGIAERSEANTIAQSSSRAKTWPGFDWTWLDNLHLAHLYAILMNCPDLDALPPFPLPDPLILGDLPTRFRLGLEFRPLATTSAVTVYELPARLCILLAEIPDAEQESIAETWRGYSEFRRQLARDLALELLGNLRDLARQALEVNKPILMRMSNF